MRSEKYHFIKTEESHLYEFRSKGPNGVVPKIVLYDNRYFQPIPIFNLAFGDYNPVTGGINDTAVSNNNDRQKILATVGATVLSFMEDRPNVVLYAEGSSAARNRLYRMGIRLIWEEIEKRMDLFGRINKQWYPFEGTSNFDAFVLSSKTLNFNPNDFNF